MTKSAEKTLEQLTEELIAAQRAYDAKKEEIIKKEKEAAERKAAELALAKDKRKKEVDDAVNHAIELIKEYTADYGNYSIANHINDLSFLFGSKPWRLFF